MNRLPVLAPLLVIAGLASCSFGLEREPPEQARFLLHAPRPTTEPPPAEGAVLEVRPFHATSPFTTTQFVYRIGEHRYETDFYREFLTAPELAIADTARDWLSDAAVAAAVVAPGSRLVPSHVLEADVTELYGDFRPEAEPRAVIGIRMTLVDRDSGMPLVHQSYREEASLASPDPEALPAAWSRALAHLLERLEADVRTALAR